MAPVSMSALAGIFTVETLTNSIAGFLGASRIASLENSEAARRRSMKLTLSFFIRNVHTCLLQPIANGSIQNPSYRNFPEPRLALKVGFQVLGKAPTVDFCLHVIHCSAWLSSQQAPFHDGKYATSSLTTLDAPGTARQTGIPFLKNSAVLAV